VVQTLQFQYACNILKKLNMKTLSLIIISCLTALTVLAQTTLSTVSIKVNGNRNLEINIDGRYFTVEDSVSNSGTAVKKTIIINDLSPGQHTLEVIRNNNNNNSDNTTTFNLRTGFDMEITINGNGSVQLKETRMRNWRTPYRPPMSDADFNLVLQDVNRHLRTSSRMTAISNAFAKTTNYFTTAQALQLVRLVSGESNRLQLAKASYRTITDAANFTRMYELLTTQASKNSLIAHVKTYNTKNPGHTYNQPNTNTSSAITAMSDANFTALYQNIQNQWQAGAKMTAITNAFSNTTYYFTTSQVRQLIQMIDTESNRLQLAKASYRSITDRNNVTRLYDLFNSQASRDEFNAYVTNYNPNNPNNNNSGNNNSYKTAMSDANFTALYQSIQNQWQAGAKVTGISNAFANTNNYFTTSQVRQLIQLIDTESNRLQLAKASYRSITDRNNVTQLYDLFNSQASRDEFNAYVTNYNPNNPNNNNSGNNNSYKTAMSDANFTALYQSIQNQWQAGAKVTAISNAFANTNNYFTTSQSRQLIQLIDAESNRLQLAKSSYRNITDPNNFPLLYDLFNSQSSLDELKAYVANYNPINPNNNTGNPNQNKTQMSDANFTTLYQGIQAEWLPGAKMNALTNTFANTTYYFSTYQAKQLIGLVSSELNRLQLAKSAYRNITDPANFPQLYDLFTTQAYRDELAEYVRNYRS
jgi:hypothetical protein